MKYIIIAVTILIASILGPSLPIVPWLVAALVAILIYKKNPVLTGALVASGTSLLSFAFFFLLDKVSPLAVNRVDNDVITAGIMFIIVSPILGAATGFIYKLFNRNKQLAPTETMSPLPVADPIVVTNKTTWPYWMIFVASFLFSPGTALLVVWQSLKRIGEKEAAKKFLLVGGLIFLVIQAIAVLSGSLSVAKNVVQFVGFGFPIWFKLSYLNKLKDKTEVLTSFSWGLAGWTILGVVITVVTNITMAVIFKFLGIISV